MRILLFLSQLFLAFNFLHDQNVIYRVSDLSNFKEDFVCSFENQFTSIQAIGSIKQSLVDLEIHYNVRSSPRMPIADMYQAKFFGKKEIRNAYQMSSVSYEISKDISKYPVDFTIFDRSGIDTTIIGKAANAKAGAVVFTKDSTIYYVDGLAAWDDVYYGKQVKVVGKLVIKDNKTDVNEKGELVQTIVGTWRILKKPKWSLVE